MNSTYHELILSRVRSAIDTARAAARVPHAGLKGQLREMLVRELFRPLFPADVGAGTGQIVSTDDRVSSQLDVVVYDRRILPAILFEGTTGLFPVEAVTATIEVKSVLNATELRSAIDAAKQLQEFMYTSGLRDRFTGGVVNHPVERLASAVFALDTDLAPGGKSEFQRLHELGGTSAALRAICVVGRGYWFAVGNDWYEAPRKYEFAEVVAFVASFSDSLPAIAATRHRPPLAEYLFRPEDFPAIGRDALPLPKLTA